MQTNCEQLITNLEKCLKNNQNYKNIYLSYSYDKNNLIKYYLYDKTYICNKNPSEINLTNCDKLDIGYKYSTNKGVNDISGFIIYNKNNEDVNNGDQYNIPIL